MALASRKLMKQLDSFAETGVRNEQMIAAVQNLLAIMNTTWQSANAFAPVPGQSPFGRYEQALVVNEVFSSGDVRQKLARIVDKTDQGLDRGPAVREINGFLYVLENRALHMYNEQSNEREW